MYPEFHTAANKQAIFYNKHLLGAVHCVQN